MRTDIGEHCNECHPELHRSQCLIGGCVAAAVFQPCSDAPIGIVTNCTAMDCETNGCAMKTPQEVVSLDDLRLDAHYAPPTTAEVTEGVTSGPMEMDQFLAYLDRLDGRAPSPDDCMVCGWSPDLHDDSHPFRAQPTEAARLYAREFAAEQLKKAARWAEANGYDDAAVDHLIRRAQELWP